MSDTKSVANFSYCLKCSETSTADHKEQSLLRKVLMSGCCKAEVQEKQLTAKEQIKVFG